MPMHNPPHPGESILDLCIEPSGETITSAAEHLGVSRKHLSAVINGRAGITADLAIRLAQAYGSSAGLWIRLQASYDAWHAEQSVSTRRIPTLGTMKAPSLAFAAPKGAQVFARRTPSLPGAARRRVTKKATAAKKRTRKSPTKPKR